MITKFSNVYAGHVDLGDMGQLSTPANERRYPNEHLATVFPKTAAIARCMDDHGFHTLWLAEDFATADILTGGRTVFGVGRGYHTREVETFGSPMLDADANRELI